MAIERQPSVEARRTKSIDEILQCFNIIQMTDDLLNASDRDYAQGGMGYADKYFSIEKCHRDTLKPYSYQQIAKVVETQLAGMVGDSCRIGINPMLLRKPGKFIRGFIKVQITYRS